MLPTMIKIRSGWFSSKLHLALIGMAMVTAVFLFVVLVTHTAAGFGEYAITMVSLVGTYSGARVAESFAARAKPSVTNITNNNDAGAT
jgi:hypothetical protein